MHFFPPGQVLQGWRISKGELVVEAMTQAVIEIGKGRELLVTRGAGKVTVFRQPAIVKQFFPQFKSLLGERVILKGIYRRGKSVGYGKCQWFGGRAVIARLITGRN
jgi:hypothetical protein